MRIRNSDAVRCNWNAATTIPGLIASSARGGLHLANVAAFEGAEGAVEINEALLHPELCQGAPRANSLSGTGGHGSPEMGMRGFHPQLTGPKDIGKHSKFSHPVHIRDSLKKRSVIFAREAGLA